MRLVHACIQSLLVMLLFASVEAVVWFQAKGQPMHQGCMLSIPTTCWQVRMLCWPTRLNAVWLSDVFVSSIGWG